ncbi:MAG: TlpA disulfide reductase family protein [Verrucomicrobiales bacterium]|nr:TlpA disulfide reductase family protein [Verrucomicrobiales bacterium]
MILISQALKCFATNRKVARGNLCALLAFFCLSPAGTDAQSPPAESVAKSKPAWLQWRNGDELKGAINESNDGTINWRAEPFAGPLKLKKAQLRGIRFSSTNREKDFVDASSFRVQLINQDRIEGELVSMDENAVRLRSPHFPEPVTIQRKSIERIVNLGNRQFRLSDPGELSDWTSSGRDRKSTEWFTDLKGEFSTHQWSGNLFRPIELPQKVELSFRAVIPDGKPNLEIGFLREPGRGPQLETWGDQLVLTCRSQFTPVMELGKEMTVIEFRLFWNQETGDVQVCEPSGRKIAELAEATAARPDSGRGNKNPLERGFYILNRTPEMRLAMLTVREWDGENVPVMDLTKPRIEFQDSASSSSVRQTLLAEGATDFSIGGKKVPVDEVREIVLNPESETPESDAASGTRIAWFSGPTVSGELLAINGEKLTLKPGWSADPVATKLIDAREIRFPPSTEAIDFGTDLLTGNGFSLRGVTRTADGNRYPQSLIAWEAPGAIGATPLADTVEATIERSKFPADRTQPPASIGRARVFLRNDEILTGDLVSLDKETIHFNSSITGPLEIPATDVRAIDIGTAGRVLEGFNDTEWEELEEDPNDVTMRNDSTLFKNGGFGNPSILLGDRLYFDAHWKRSSGSMTLKFFTSSAEASGNEVVILAQGNRLFVGKTKPGGAFSFSNNQTEIENNRASIQITANSVQIEIRVDGKLAFTHAVDPESISGNGLYFKMGGGWQGFNQSGSEIELTNFRIEQTAGSIPLRIIDKKSKENTLTVPRSLRDDLPTHVLIAPNGDLLRGKLIAAVGDTIQFEANAEMIDFPRKRISAIVWLTEPEATAIAGGPPQEEAEPVDEKLLNPFEPSEYEKLKQFNFKVTHQIVMKDGSRLQIRSDRIEDGKYVGHSAILGRCRLPISNVHSMTRSAPTPIHKAAKLDLVVFDDWDLTLTPDPVIPTGEEAPASPLIGTKAPAIELTMLDESRFSLKEQKGKIVVLDFWATWCGPCIKAMPDVKKAISAFPAEAVTFCAINQAESPPIINGFLKNRKWEDTPVALDFTMKVSNAYQVKGIPHTVVIDPEGEIAWIHSGYSETLKEELFEAIAAILQKQAQR